MNDRAFSSIDLVGQCLLDQYRTNLFKKAIKKMVTTQSVVIDAGTGSGILAILSAKAGAKEVYAIEKDPYIANIAKKNIESNGLEKKIKVIEADMESVVIPTNKHIDIVIMEMLTTGMIDESQVKAINNLKKNVNIDEKTLFLPNEQQNFITFGYSDFKIYGLKIPMVLHLWDIHAKLNDHFSKRSKKIVYDIYNFSKEKRLCLEKCIDIPITNSGKINAILLESRSILGQNLYLDETPALNGKVLIPIPEVRGLKNNILKGKLKYEYGKGFESLTFNW